MVSYGTRGGQFSKAQDIQVKVISECNMTLTIIAELVEKREKMSLKTSFKLCSYA